MKTSRICDDKTGGALDKGQRGYLLRMGREYRLAADPPKADGLGDLRVARGDVSRSSPTWEVLGFYEVVSVSAMAEADPWPTKGLPPLDPETVYELRSLPEDAAPWLTRPAEDGSGRTLAWMRREDGAEVRS